MVRRSDDQARLDEWNAAQKELRDGETAMDRLAFLRADQQTPWNHSGFTRNPSEEIVVGAFFPETVQDEDEWERNAVLMHERQETITVPDKPSDGGASFRRGRETAVATFERQQAEAIPNFADTEHATGKHRSPNVEVPEGVRTITRS